MAQPAAGWWRTAVVSQVGGKVNEGRCRLQYTSALDEQAEPSGAKEWRMLSELRPVPPPPPKDWLAAVRTNEVALTLGPTLTLTPIPTLTLTPTPTFTLSLTPTRSLSLSLSLTLTLSKVLELARPDGWLTVFVEEPLLRTLTLTLTLTLTRTAAANPNPH